MRFKPQIFVGLIVLGFGMGVPFTPDRAYAKEMQASVSDGMFTYYLTRFDGPGNFCASDFLLKLEPGDRAILMDPKIDFWRYIIDVGGRKVGTFSGIGQVPKGKTVRQSGDQKLAMIATAGAVPTYFLARNPSMLTSIESPTFVNWDDDQWFFGRMTMGPETPKNITCIHGVAVKDVKELSK